MPLVLTVIVWLRYSGGPLPTMIESVPWIPALGVGYKVGVDGFSLPLVALSALLFPVSMAYPLDLRGRERTYYGLFLFLEAASLGVFLALDLFLFFVFWDLSLVGMYFVIAIWGHGDAARSAIKFFIYTLTGSLALLLAIIGLYLATAPHTFDMISIIQDPPLSGSGLRASLIFLGFVIAFVIKSPLVPLHTWLPPAHVDAPGPGSAILAGRAPEDGHLRVHPHHAADDAGHLSPLRLRARRARGDQPHLRGAGRPCAEQPETPHRLHEHRPHGPGRARHRRGRRPAAGRRGRATHRARRRRRSAWSAMGSSPVLSS